jgi:hypothetical protein
MLARRMAVRDGRARPGGGPADGRYDNDPFDNDPFDDDPFDGDDRFGDDDDDLGEDDDWRLRPQWLQDCADPCTALDLGTCCKYRAAPVVRCAVQLADSVDDTLSRAGRDECVAVGAELGRLRLSVPRLLAQIHAVVPSASAATVAQLLCPVGRLAGALDQVCVYGCPWACDDPAVPDRRAELEPLRVLLDECSAALRAALGLPRPPR